MKRVRSRGGYTLPEVLMYGVILAAIVNLCTALFLSARRVYDLGEISITRMEALREMESDLREAASQSDARTDAIHGLTLPNVVLVLHGSSDDGAETFAVFRQGDDHALIFETYASRNGRMEITSQHGYPIDVTAARATAFAGAQNLVEFTVTVDNVGTRHTIPETNVFVARIGGGDR